MRSERAGRTRWRTAAPLRAARARIWLCGGGSLAGRLAEEIDELVIKTYPVPAGAGIPVISAEFAPRRFELTDTRSFDNGAVVSKCARKR